MMTGASAAVAGHQRLALCSRPRPLLCRVVLRSMAPTSFNAVLAVLAVAAASYIANLIFGQKQRWDPRSRVSFS